MQTVDQVREFYHLFEGFEFAQIIDEPIPISLVAKYSQKGLPLKADAFIGAFVEWKNLDVLLSDNRHFLRELTDPAFLVYTPSQFAERIFG